MFKTPRQTRIVFTILVIITVAALISAVVFYLSWKPETTVPTVAEEPTRDPLVLQIATQLANLQLPVASQEGTEESTEEPIETPVPKETPITEVSSGSSDIKEILRISDALDYPKIVEPDAKRQLVFPDVPNNDRPALVEYSLSWEDGDYFEDSKGDVDLPEWHYRVMTAGVINIPGIVNCQGDDEKGCLVILINHFGKTKMWRGAEIDNGFTVTGRVWDMSTPNLVTLSGQALLDHYVMRMTIQDNPGANCSTIDGCKTVEWHVIVIGNGEAQVHWTGLFFR